MYSEILLWATGVSHLRREKRKNRVTTRRQTKILVLSVLRGDVIWPENVEDDVQRDTAVGNWRQSPEARKAKKSSDDAATDEDPNASIFGSDVVWLENIEDDVQRDTALGNWRQSPKARKAKKSSDDAATDRDTNSSILRNDVVWLENVEDDGQRKTAARNWRQSPETR